MNLNSLFRRSILAAAAASIAFVCVGVFGQTSKPDNAVASSAQPSVSKNQYMIGPGDVLDIRIYNRPQLSRESVRVDERGMIRLPLINEIRAECQTESDLANGITQSYLEYLKNPQVEVFIKDYQSQPVIVLGAVREPGRFQLQRRVHLLEIVSLAGGLTDTAGGRIQVTHASDRRSCEEKAAVTQTPQAPADAINAQTEIVEWYDVSELLKNAKDSLPYVRPGDTINLLEANKAYIVGNVMKPAEISLKEPVTLSQAIAMAGGAMPDSKLGKIRIVRQPPHGAKSELIVDLHAINKRKAEDVVLQANDIIEVPTSTGKKVFRDIMNSVVPGLSRLPVRVIR